jgi:hypothetical protein
MAIITPNEGTLQLLKHMLGVTSTPTLTLRLYTAIVGGVPSKTTVFANVTEVSNTDYHTYPLTPSDWVISTDADNSTNAVFNVSLPFYSSVPITVLGYYITDSSNFIMWIEQFASPQVLYPNPHTPPSITFTPKISLI